MSVKKDGVKLLQQGVDRQTNRYFALIEVISNGISKQCIVECDDIDDIDAKNYTVQFVTAEDMTPYVEMYNTRIFDDIEQEALLAFAEMKDQEVDVEVV